MPKDADAKGYDRICIIGNYISKARKILEQFCLLQLMRSRIVTVVPRAATLAFIGAGVAVVGNWDGNGLQRGAGATNDKCNVHDRAKKKPICTSNKGCDPSVITALLLNVFGVSHCTSDTKGNRWYGTDSVACKKAADEGDAGAQHAMSHNYKHGYGVSKNAKESFRYAKLAADQGYAHAMNDVGGCYINGTGVKKNDSEGLRYYLKGSELGHAGCMYNAAICYGNGLGAPEDRSLSFQYLKRASDLGHAAAAGSVGISYTNGLGVEVNEIEAAKYYLLGAERGDTVSQRCIATCYWNAHGVEKDLDKAVFFFKLAAENGDLSAQQMLGSVYRNGFESIEQSIGEAKKYFGMAAAQGDRQSRIDHGGVIIDEIVGIVRALFSSK